MFFSAIAIACRRTCRTPLELPNEMGRIKQGRLANEERRRRAIMLGELEREGIDIFCWCNRCGHNAVLPAGLFVAQLGPAFPVPDVGAHTRCGGCGGKDVATRPAWPSLGQVTRHHAACVARDSVDD